MRGQGMVKENRRCGIPGLDGICPSREMLNFVEEGDNQRVIRMVATHTVYDSCVQRYENELEGERGKSERSA